MYKSHMERVMEGEIGTIKRLKAMKYCKVCGEKLVQGERMGYDPETGEPIHEKLCPTGICSHNGGHRMQTISNGKFNWGFNKTQTSFCTRCSYRYDHYDPNDCY